MNRFDYRFEWIKRRQMFIQGTFCHHLLTVSIFVSVCSRSKSGSRTGEPANGVNPTSSDRREGRTNKKSRDERKKIQFDCRVKIEEAMGSCGTPAICESANQLTWWRPTWVCPSAVECSCRPFPGGRSCSLRECNCCRTCRPVKRKAKSTDWLHFFSDFSSPKSTRMPTLWVLRYLNWWINKSWNF